MWCQPGHAWLSQHYKWGLERLFEPQRRHSHAIICEDDMQFSPDFLHMFAATAILLDKDPSLWCVSSWNDNGLLKDLDWDPKRMVSRGCTWPFMHLISSRCLFLGTPLQNAAFAQLCRMLTSESHEICVLPGLVVALSCRGSVLSWLYLAFSISKGLVLCRQSNAPALQACHDASCQVDAALMTTRTCDLPVGCFLARAATAVLHAPPS